MTSLADSEIHPPAYPLDRDAFKRALKTGHGRALVHARDFGLADFREEVLDAATDCKVYDTQIDGQREWWLAQLCESAGLVDAIIGLAPDDSSRNRHLRACLLREFYLRGHHAALPGLYALCRYTVDSNNVEAVIQLIDVEGRKGLVFAARKLGEALLADSDFWVSDWELSYYDDLHGHGSAREILTDAASSDSAIRHYLQEVAAYELRKNENSTSDEKPLEPVESVVQTILSSTKRVGWLRGWGINASQEDRAEVAKLLKTESKVPVLLNVIWCLKRNGVPHFDPSLLNLVFHEDEQVRFHAGQMLSHQVDPQVRAAGFSLLERGDLTVATELLQLNATEEDAPLILAALARKPEDDNHSTITNLVSMLEDAGTIRRPEIPLHIYEHSPCMLCREHAIEILIKNENCPQWLLDEAAFDGSEEIRELITNLKA